MSSDAGANRFFKEVLVIEREGRFELRLDDRSLRTRGRNVLRVPSSALAEAIRTEWVRQGDRIDPSATPLTSLVSAAIDADDQGLADWRNDVLSYLGADLLCYRADRPEALAARQEQIWSPILEWMRSELGASLVVTSGVIKIVQPDAAIQAIRAVLEKTTPLELLAIRQATTLTGSGAIALALWRGAFTAAALFDASLVDETFQAEKWGEDAEASMRRQQMRAEFMVVADLLSWAREQP